MSTYEYRSEYKTGPDGYHREYRSGPEGTFQNETRTESGLSTTGIDASVRPPTNLSNYSSSHLHSSSSVSPMPRSVVTEEYTYSTRNKPGGSYSITKGPFIRVESNHQGPDYRAHLGPRPALGGRRQYTQTTTINRDNIGGRPNLH